MTVQTLLQSLLIKVVANEANRTAEDKESVEDANVQVLLSLFSGKAATASQQVHDAGGHHAVHVQNEVWFLKVGV